MPTGYWVHFRKFIVSLLKAWYGDAATPDNDFCFSWLPRVDADYSQLAYFDRMARGESKAISCSARTPAAAAPTPACTGPACATSTGWWSSTGSRPRAPSSGRATRWRAAAAEIKTEVFFIPAAASPEKEGSLTNTQRLLQWHDKAVDPLGDCRSDAWFLYNLGKRLKQLYAGSTDPRDQPLLHLTWDYDFDERPRLPDGTLSRIEGEPDLEKVLQEINGYKLDEVDPRTGRPRLLTGFSELKDDGSTACGCWIYSGVFPEPGRNRRPRAHRTDNPLQPDWGFAWPDNRRVLYNRASAAPDGRPWSERKKLVWWDAESHRWVGLDRPDFEPEQAARLPTAARRDGHGGHRGQPAVHLEARRPRLAVRPRRQGWALADALRARRVAGGQPALPQADVQPHGAPLRGTAQPHRPHADGGVPGGGDHVPAHRALPERADEPLQQLAQRIAAGDVRRAEPGAGRRARHQSTAAG